MSDWQPIETAPRGEHVLITDGEIISIGSAWEESGESLWWQVEGGVSGHEIDWEFQYRTIKFWMPLPAPPK